jgi:hypothetical protein
MWNQADFDVSDLMLGDNKTRSTLNMGMLGGVLR